jgi:hypothetical protein
MLAVSIGVDRRASAVPVSRNEDRSLYSVVNTLRLATIVTVLLAFRDGVVAQGPPPRERIYFSVLNRELKPRLGLTEKDFILRINGRSVVMEDFRPGRGHTDRSRPLVAWILLESSPFVSSRVIADQADAAAGFLDMLHPDSAVGVRLITDRAETLAPLTRNRRDLREAFTRFAKDRRELKAVPSGETVFLGEEGMFRAMDLAITDLNNFRLSDASLQGKEVPGALILVAGAGLNPWYDERILTDKAARRTVFIYPIVMPAATHGVWRRYSDLAQNAAGVLSGFGALGPDSNSIRSRTVNLDRDALTFNFIHIVRDLNGKYSFLAPPVPPGDKVELELKCREKGVHIQVPRKHLP